MTSFGTLKDCYIHIPVGSSDSCYVQEFEEGPGHTLERKRRCIKNYTKSLQRNFDNAREGNRNRRKLAFTNRRRDFVSRDAVIFVLYVSWVSKKKHRNVTSA
ncbi:hypothetical protein NPIL_647811 [Nephila pilipes]|uniref:Uncharacterized protein n=1 Tax=Nephila pilipes TaxID=299642 RepID=A0A8X6U2X3_NEPPI|nr:hypothetical protein NPIL_647811 [Nephila pilipes]